MKHKDAWLFGLFALAYLYLDTLASPAPVARPAEERVFVPPADEPPPFPMASLGIVPRDACPRNVAHRVSLRGDGAMWCLSCDEGFYPEITIWGSLMGSVAA